MVATVTKATALSTLDARAILELDLEGIKLIEASAGTGKTHTIADLYLRHILAGRQTSQILIVTYTNAATEELRGRIRKRLYDALNLFNQSSTDTDELFQLLLEQWQDLDEVARTLQLVRLQLALRSMDEASISTIHSFCQRSLQENALSGNQLFDSDMLTSDDQLWEAAIKDWWRRRTYAPDGDTWRLIHDQLPDLNSLIATLLELRNKPSAKFLPADQGGITRLLNQARDITSSLHQLAPLWRQHQTDIVRIISNSKVLSRARKLPYHRQQVAAFLDAADTFFNADEVADVFAGFEYLGAELLEQNSMPSKRGQDPDLEHEFFQAIDPLAKSWQGLVGSIAPQLRADAFHAVSRQVLESKREMAVLAFQDQLSLLLEALESDRGENLAERLRQQYPVAMIDEFQDTDTIQYQIFKHIYMSAEHANLTLIGDPKQAIYSFRGGDIFTYMQARQLPGADLFGLQTNWRSQPNLVQAINTLFAHRPDAFIYHDSIAFSAVASVMQNKNHELRLQDQAATAMTLWQLPVNEQHKNYSRGEMRDLINRAIVTEIAGLLEMAGRQSATIDGRAVQSGDIAILVRQASEGLALSRLLHRHGIRTVTIGRDSVFKSDEARGLYDLLLAISQYRDPAVATRSLSSSLLNLDYRQIADVVDADTAWQSWVDELDELQQLWERQGFIAMFQSMLHKFEITRHLAQQDNNERRITNLLQLAELLQQQSAITAGMSPMLSWFQEQFDEDGNEEAELRLEDDEALVKIITIHKSKGLQYPIVFVPFLWSCKQVDRAKAIYFHDAELLPCVDLGSPEFERNWLIAEKERLAEDIRLLYVALTRARSKVYLAWGRAGKSGISGYANQTALAYLLHSKQAPQDLDSTVPDGFPANMDFTADLQALVANSAASIALLPLPRDDISSVYCSAGPKPPTAELAEFSRINMTQWRIYSFTALTRGIHQPANLGAMISQGDPVLDFPAGSHVGLLLHSLLENIDFQQDIQKQCNQLLPRFLPLAGFSVEHETTLTAWLEQILSTPLDGAALVLTNISNRQRLNELAFDFALDQLHIGALNQFMQSLSPLPLQAVSSPEFCGLITGVIDLVFEYQGRYYLADYKTNLLGRRLEDYRPENLQQAMLGRRYDLQALLYAVALHRLLAVRLPDYHYEQHFGGCYYLFLRAMRPQHGNRFGVHFDRPEEKTIQQLDQLMKFSRPEPIDR
jgi:exodeoxyribonuclease V beta subunit